MPRFCQRKTESKFAFISHNWVPTRRAKELSYRKAPDFKSKTFEAPHLTITSGHIPKNSPYQTRLISKLAKFAFNPLSNFQIILISACMITSNFKASLNQLS